VRIQYPVPEEIATATGKEKNTEVSDLFSWQVGFKI